MKKFTHNYPSTRGEKLKRLQMIYAEQMCDICKGEEFVGKHLKEQYNQLKKEFLIMTCPDCEEPLVKTFIECEDGSGWYCGWLCKCKPLQPNR